MSEGWELHPQVRLRSRAEQSLKPITGVQTMITALSGHLCPTPRDAPHALRTADGPVPLFVPHKYPSLLSFNFLVGNYVEI